MHKGSGDTTRSYQLKLKQIKRTAALALALFITLSVPAASNDILGLREAIKISLENNNSYKIAKEKVNESKLRVRESWGKLWPDISTGASMTRFGADKGIMTTSYGEYDITFVKCSVAINPGVFYNSLRASQDGHMIAAHDERRIKLDTTIMTIRLYYKILLTAEIIKMRNDSIKALEENLKVVTAGYKTGSYTRLDFLRAKVAAANEKTRRINAENDYLSAIAELNIHMGRDIDSPLELDRDTIAKDTGEESAIMKWSDKEKKERLAFMTAESLKNRPEIIQIKSKKNALAHAAWAGDSLYLWPTLFASGSYGTNKIIPKNAGQTTGDIHADLALYDIGKILEPMGWNKNWNVVVGATYRWGGAVPFDPSHAKADQYRSQEKQADLEMDDFLRNLRLNIQQGILKLISASNAILSQKENIESAEESLRVSIIQFKNGMIDNPKFLDSIVELSNAKTLYIQALYDLQTSKAELNRAIGYDFFAF
jgi:outer membrane protein